MAKEGVGSIAKCESPTFTGICTSEAPLAYASDAAMRRARPDRGDNRETGRHDDRPSRERHERGGIHGGKGDGRSRHEALAPEPVIRQRTRIYAKPPTHCSRGVIPALGSLDRWSASPLAASGWLRAV